MWLPRPSWEAIGMVHVRFLKPTWTQVGLQNRLQIDKKSSLKYYFLASNFMHFFVILANFWEAWGALGPSTYSPYFRLLPVPGQYHRTKKMFLNNKNGAQRKKDRALGPKGVQTGPGIQLTPSHTKFAPNGSPWHHVGHPKQNSMRNFAANLAREV